MPVADEMLRRRAEELRHIPRHTKLVEAPEEYNFLIDIE
jgi:hypothetical protein